MVVILLIKLLPKCFKGGERKSLVHQSSDVTIEEITGVQVINEERLYDSPVAVFDAVVQIEKEENSSGDA
ncbi:hypothetical protein F2Q68_00000302 [Brassica cretica]|uniref:Uncharacterized protein n=2 Tax=Brassica cretica TaxID=69181 RepID=A0A3N6Q1L4_BRACR|nr:hypothetical protein F2Q68_00000302 [Brassica cretica]KAF3514267.1 hypothetical protein F2Q69_00000377 [Brassica cretica]KAF3546450.1 hypothetical protein DY000_02000412 [Brassica cretica]